MRNEKPEFCKTSRLCIGQDLRRFGDVDDLDGRVQPQLRKRNRAFFEAKNLYLKIESVPSFSSRVLTLRDHRSTAAEGTFPRVRHRFPAQWF